MKSFFLNVFRLSNAGLCHYTAASDPDDAMVPNPILATTVEEILSSKGVKPSLSPNLKVLAEVEARGIKKLLFIGVGCAVQALRGVEPYLGLDALYVMAGAGGLAT